jgi:hypothetical protein
MKNDNATAKDIRIEMIVEKMRQYQCKDFKQWYYYRSVLQGMDPHHPQLELGFHGLPFFGHRID